jgi:hypothetical protein
MAARDEDKAMAGLLRRSLAQDAGTGSGEDCPKPEILAAYFDHALDAKETARYDLHFSRCAVCREQLAAMARAGGDDAAVRKAAGTWGWLVGPRWLVPAAAALVVLLVIGGIALRMRKPVAPADETAMLRPDAVASPSPELPAKSTPEAAPPATRENLPLRPAAPSPRDAASAAIELRESQASRVSGATSVAGAKAGVSHANTASRRDKFSVAGAANANPPAGQATAMQPPPVMAQQNGSRIVRGAMRAGNANPAAAAPANSADQSATSAAPAPVPATPADNKVDAQSVESDLNAAVEAEAAKEKNAEKTKLPATTPAHAVGAMNLTASQAMEAATLAKMQQAQISSNLMNLQIPTPDPKIFWMIPGPGAIERSENGGADWKTEYLDTRALIVAGAAPTAKICWLVGANGTILRTTNGAHWKTISPPAKTDFVRVEATDALNATVMAIDGRKFSTADGGKSWSSLK